MGDYKIAYRVPTVIERMKYARQFVDSIGEPQTIIRLDYERNGCLWNKMEIYKEVMANGYTHICMNDDDSIACDGYKTIVNTCVRKFPDAIITFYNHEIRRSFNTPFVRLLNCNCSGTAMIVPVKYLNAYFSFYDRYLAKYNFDWEDTSMKMFALMSDIPVICVFPNPVTVVDGLVTVARRGKYIQPQSGSFVPNFPLELLEINVVETYKCGLFNLHLNDKNPVAIMLKNKWEAVKRESGI